MSIQRIHHVAYRCHDAKATVNWYRQHLGRKARRVSASDKMAKSSMIMDVTPDEVPKVMGLYQVRHLIHGHTHRPAVHELQLRDGQSAWRYVLGDWYSQSAYLEVRPTGWQLHFTALPSATTLD